MSAAWQYAFEKRMGLFAVEDEDAIVNPLAVHEGAQLLSVPPLVEPHDLWIRFLIERIEIAKHCSHDQVQINMNSSLLIVIVLADACIASSTESGRIIRPDVRRDVTI